MRVIFMCNGGSKKGKEIRKIIIIAMTMVVASSNILSISFNTKAINSTNNLKKNKFFLIDKTKIFRIQNCMCDTLFTNVC